MNRVSCLATPALLALMALSACSDNTPEKKPAPPPVPVTVAKAVQQDVPLSLEFVGRAEAFESVTLKARVDGQVASVHFTEGQHVKAGDILLRLDPTDFAARLKQAEANVARDKAQQLKAHNDSQRYEALRNRNFISDEKLADVRTAEAATAANLKADEAALELARAQLSYATIRAPFDGVVGARLVFPGSAVKVNDTTLAVVNRARPLLVTFAVPEKLLPQLKAAVATAGGKLPVNVGLPGDKNARFEGELRFVDNAVDTSTGTIQLKATLPNADEALTPGQFLNVSLQLSTLKDTITVPNEAVQQGPEGNYVFAVKEDGSVELRKIRVATAWRGQSAIGEGLKAGETVVTDGQLRLTPGAKIKPSEPGKADAAKGNATAPATPGTPAAPATLSAPQTAATPPTAPTAK